MHQTTHSSGTEASTAARNLLDRRITITGEYPNWSANANQEGYASPKITQGSLSRRRGSTTPRARPRKERSASDSGGPRTGPRPGTSSRRRFDESQVSPAQSLPSVPMPHRPEGNPGVALQHRQVLVFLNCLNSLERLLKSLLREEPVSSSVFTRFVSAFTSLSNC